MLRLQSLANVNRRRTLRALYAQTQGYPYAVALDSTVDRTLTNPFTIAADAGKAAIWPGMVAVKTVGETVKIAAADTGRAFGLFANFVGGELNEIGTNGSAPGGSEVGVWRGPGSVYEVLAPVFVDTGLSAAAAAEDGAHANEVFLGPDATGRLKAQTLANTTPPTGDDVTSLASSARSSARLVKRLSANAIIIELLV